MFSSIKLLLYFSPVRWFHLCNSFFFAKLSKLGTSTEITKYLIDEAKVNVNDGKFYGSMGEGHLRVVTGCFWDDKDCFDAKYNIDKNWNERKYHPTSKFKSFVFFHKTSPLFFSCKMISPMQFLFLCQAFEIRYVNWNYKVFNWWGKSQCQWR